VPSHLKQLEVRIKELDKLYAAVLLAAQAHADGDPKGTITRASGVIKELAELVRGSRTLPFGCDCPVWFLRGNAIRSIAQPSRQRR